MADDYRLYRVRHGDRHSRRRGHALGREGALVEVPVYWALDDWPLLRAGGRAATGCRRRRRSSRSGPAELRYAHAHAPRRPADGDDAPRVHRARPPDGDARDVHRARRRRSPGVVFERLDRTSTRSGSRGRALGRRSASARVRARSRTASNIGGVRRPVNVFCWLGWYEPSRTYGPTRASAPWPNRGFGRGAA